MSIQVLNVRSDDEKYNLVVVADDRITEWPQRGLLTRVVNAENTEVFRFEKTDASPYWVLIDENISAGKGAKVLVKRGLDRKQAITVALLSENAEIICDDSGRTTTYVLGIKASVKDAQTPGFVRVASVKTGSSTTAMQVAFQHIRNKYVKS